MRSSEPDNGIELRNLAGWRGPPYPMEVERGKIREFARAVYSNNRAYVEEAQPVVPPTFLLVSGYVWGYTLERIPRHVSPPPIGAPLDLSGTLDAEEEFVFPDSLPRAGARLTVEPRFVAVQEKQGRRGGRLTLFSMSTEFRAADRLVAELRSLWIRAERAPAEPKPELGPRVERPFFVRGTEFHQFDRVAGGRPGELRVGEGPGPVHMPPLTLTEIVRFQGALGACSPLHHDEQCAQTEGYPTYTSVGMLHASALATYATNWLGAENIRRFKSRFEQIVWPGDRLSYQGILERIRTDAGRRLAEVSLGCRRDDGSLAVSAEATFVLPS